MGIPMGIPVGIPVGMGWVWGLKCHPHGSPGNLQFSDGQLQISDRRDLDAKNSIFAP